MQTVNTEIPEPEKWKKMDIQKPRQKSGLCDDSCARYSEKRFTQI